MRKTKHGQINGAIMLTGDQLQQKLNCGHQTAVKIGKEAKAPGFRHGFSTLPIPLKF